MDLFSKLYVAALLFGNLQICYSSCEGVICGGVVVIVAIGAGYTGLHWGVNWVYCSFDECCTDRWTQPEHKDENGILGIFNAKLFGQHIVMKTVPHAIHNHLNDKNPRKPLVMSFHGWTGCGKSFVSRLIAEYIYRKGEDSIYVHTKISSEHFPDPSKTEQYKHELKEFVKEKNRLCGRSLFIFDEVDKMPDGLANVIKNYIDFQKVDGVDYRKNIFIFLNNIGGKEISDVALSNFREGKAREDIKVSTMENILSRTALELKGGFQSSELILSGLVDYFIPFFPLERHHVRQCASADIKRRLNETERKMNRDEQKDIVDKTVGEIQFYPKGKDAIFALTGCKHVTKKIDMFF